MDQAGHQHDYTNKPSYHTVQSWEGNLPPLQHQSFINLYIHDEASVTSNPIPPAPASTVHVHKRQHLIHNNQIQSPCHLAMSIIKQHNNMDSTMMPTGSRDTVGPIFFAVAPLHQCQSSRQRRQLYISDFIKSPATQSAIDYTKMPSPTAHIVSHHHSSQPRLTRQTPPQCTTHVAHKLQDRCHPAIQEQPYPVGPNQHRRRETPPNPPSPLHRQMPTSSTPHFTSLLHVAANTGHADGAHIRFTAIQHHHNPQAPSR